MKEIKRADSGTGTPEAETVGSEPKRSPTTVRITEDRMFEILAIAGVWQNAVPDQRPDDLTLYKALRDCLQEIEALTTERLTWQARFHCPRHGSKDWDASCICDLKHTGIE